MHPTSTCVSQQFNSRPALRDQCDFPARLGQASANASPVLRHHHAGAKQAEPSYGCWSARTSCMARPSSAGRTYLEATGLQEGASVAYLRPLPSSGRPRRPPGRLIYESEATLNSSLDNWLVGIFVGAFGRMPYLVQACRRDLRRGMEPCLCLKGAWATIAQTRRLRALNRACAGPSCRFCVGCVA